MTSCCHGICRATDRQFDRRVATRDLRRFRRKGPDFTTRIIRDGVRGQAPGATLLDIGAGVGVLTFELLDAGVRHATVVDASSAYLDAAREEAVRRGRSEQMAAVHGDFVTVAAAVPAADIVTLDRVVCCYPFVEPLLLGALERARRCVAFSYPRDRWYVRAVVAVENFARRLTRNAFRTFVHPTRPMQDLMARHGFRLETREANIAWCADVYARAEADR